MPQVTHGLIDRALKTANDCDYTRGRCGAFHTIIFKRSVIVAYFTRRDMAEDFITGQIAVMGE